eukprot:SAG11_NODE_2075_length_3857_cov_64.192656_2_plen_356_part_00
MRTAEQEKVKIEVQYRALKDESEIMRTIVDAIVSRELHKREGFPSEMRRVSNLVANYCESVTRVQNAKQDLKVCRKEKEAETTTLRVKIARANKIKEKLDAEKIRYSASCLLTTVQLYLLSHVSAADEQDLTEDFGHTMTRQNSLNMESIRSFDSSDDSDSGDDRVRLSVSGSETVSGAGVGSASGAGVGLGPGVASGPGAASGPDTVFGCFFSTNAAFGAGAASGPGTVSGPGAASGAGAASASGAAWTPSSSWVYIDDAGTEFGPYSSETMKYWYENRQLPENVMVRNSSDGSEFTEIKLLVTKGEFDAARKSPKSQVVKPRTRRKKMKTHPTAGQAEFNAFFGSFAFLVLCG